MTQAPFAVFAVVAANYQRSMQRSPRESWAADARRTTEQRHAGYSVRCFPLFLETSAHRMIAFSCHNYIKPEAFCQFDTCHFRINLDPHYPRFWRWLLNHPYNFLELKACRQQMSHFTASDR
jgi:hypothetical protein